MSTVSVHGEVIKTSFNFSDYDVSLIPKKENMDIRNDTSNKYFFAHLVRRPMTEVASILKFNICYIALASLLAEKRIYVKENMDTAKGDLVGMFDTLKYQSIKIT